MIKTDQLLFREEEGHVLRNRKVMVMSLTSRGQNKVLKAMTMLKPLTSKESEGRVTSYCTWRSDAQRCLSAGDCSNSFCQASSTQKA